jgi:hypothetical protein
LQTRVHRVDVRRTEVVGDLERQRGERILAESKPEAISSYNLQAEIFHFKAAQQDLRPEKRQPASAFSWSGDNELHTPYSASSQGARIK